MLHYDKVLESLGEFGPYQKRLCFLMFLATIPNGLYMSASVFNNVAPDFRCAIPGFNNDSYKIRDQHHRTLVQDCIPKDGEHYSQCESYDLDIYTLGNGSIIVTKTEENNTHVPCHRWVYDKDGPISHVVDFDLVCDRMMYKAHGNMMLLVGILVGSLIGGIVTDFTGRKLSILIGVVCMNIVGGIMAAAQSIHVILGLRFLFTVASSLGFMAVFVILAETVGTSRRSVASMSSMIGWTAGQFLCVLVQYFVRDWRTAQLVAAVPLMCLVGLWWLIDESPRWLLTKNRTNQAQKVISHIAKVNKVTLQSEMEMMTEITMVMSRDGKAGDEVTKAPSGSDQMKIWHIFSQKRILFRFIILCFSWVTINMVYYGLMLGVGDIIEGNIYINFILQSSMELIGHVICVFILEKLDRKKIYCTSMIITGLATLGICAIVVSETGIQWLTILLFCLGKFGITNGFNLIFIITAELLPTSIRNSGLGFCSFVARFSGVVSPYIVSASLLIPGPIGKAFPVLIFGAFSLLAGLTSMLLPETRNVQLPETFDDDHNTSSTKHA